jgi:hypothetical protein
VLGGQLDAVATIMGRLRLSYDDYTFGHDLLDSSRTGTDYAHFSEWYDIGYIEDGYYAVIRTQGRSSLFDKEDLTVDCADKFPDLLSEFERRALAIYEMGYQNMKRPLQPKQSRLSQARDEDTVSLR